MITILPETFTRPEAARRLGVAVGTLKRWAAEGIGPRYSRTGTVKGKAIYSAADLAEWLAAHRAVPRASRGETTTGNGR